MTDKRNLRILNIWVAIWVIVSLTSLKVMETYGDESLAISSVTMAVAALATIAVIMAYGAFFVKRMNCRV